MSIFKNIFLIVIVFFPFINSFSADLNVIREDGDGNSPLFFKHSKGRMFTVISGDHELSSKAASKKSGVEKMAAPYLVDGTQQLLQVVFEKKYNNIERINCVDISKLIVQPTEYACDDILFLRGSYRTDGYFAKNFSNTKYKKSIGLLPFSNKEGGIIYVVACKRTHQDYVKGSKDEVVPNNRGKDLSDNIGDAKFIRDNAELYYSVLDMAHTYNQIHPTDPIKVVRFCGIGAGFFRKRNNGSEVDQNDCIKAGEGRIISFNIENPDHGITISIPNDAKFWPQGADSLLP